MENGIAKNVEHYMETGLIRVMERFGFMGLLVPMESNIVSGMSL